MRHRETSLRVFVTEEEKSTGTTSSLDDNLTGLNSAVSCDSWYRSWTPIGQSRTAAVFSPQSDDVRSEDRLRKAG
jgi:hypothetical protein